MLNTTSGLKKTHILEVQHNRRELDPKGQNGSTPNYLFELQIAAPCHDNTKLQIGYLE